LNWTEVLKAKLPNEVLPDVIDVDTARYMRNIPRDVRNRFASSLTEMKDGKLVNARIWLKQMKATINATYNAIIQSAEKIDALPMSTATAAIAPLRNKAIDRLNKTISQMKEYEEGLKDARNNDGSLRIRYSDMRSVQDNLKQMLKYLYDDVQSIFLNQMRDALRKVSPDAEAIWENASGGKVARTVNPNELKPRDVDKVKPQLLMEFDEIKDRVDFYIAGNNLDRVKSQRANTTVDFDWDGNRKRFNINYLNLPGTVPVGLAQDISLSKEVSNRVKSLLRKLDRGLDIPKEVADDFVEYFKKTFFRNPPLQILTKDEDKILFGINESDLPMIRIGQILIVEETAEDWRDKGNIEVTFSVTSEGTAPDNVMTKALDEYIANLGKGSKTMFFTEEGTAATDKQISELEPERERLTEEMQEETGGGFYPALESYLDSKDDSLSEYKYKIAIKNRDDASDIARSFKITLGSTPLFEFSYVITGAKDDIFRKMVDDIVMKQIKGE